MAADKPLKIKVEATGRTREDSIGLPESRRVFARGPIGTWLKGSAGKKHPVFDWLMLEDGRWFDFDRFTKELRRGDDSSFFDPEQASVGELFLSPGMIYKPGFPDPAELQKWQLAQQTMQSRLLAPTQAGGVRVLTGRK